jgi:murein tripeptide amidase MpaA
VCYYRTPSSGKGGGGGGSKNLNGTTMYALSFVYTYKFDGDCVFFAYNYPYTFSRLQRLIHRLELDPVRQKVLRRRVLCHTLSGNACDVLTVTAPIKNNDELRQRKIVVVSARVHPGETVASWMMHGLIDFITGNSPVACELREKIVFKLIPMLNPDGVINGNYRCSLAGIDLNRRWDRPSRVWHPTIWHTKQLIKQFNLPPNAGRVLAYIDLHGHSRKKNVFIYGCDPTKSQKH